MNVPNFKLERLRTKQEVEHIYLNDCYIPQRIGYYYIKTYGCQMNVHDSEEISYRLESLGYIKTQDMQQADIIVLNTCAVRENAHDKVFGFMGRCKHLKQQKPELIIALCGCMAQEENVVKQIIEKHPYIDLVFGTHNINELQDLVLKYTGKQNINVYSIEGKVYENINYKRDSKIKAWVNIMYGCDKFCTYCIVPYTRGKQRSRKSKDILKEVISLKNQGYQEITLLGQNVNAYGKDLEDEIDFSSLLQAVAETNIPRIRFVTSHPWDFTSQMIDVIAKYPNIMPYIHLPIQSGSNNILKLMGRRYTKEEYLDLFKEIKQKIPDVAISTDIIVGFPNESQQDFEDTLDVVNKVQFDNAYTFIYSPRENTPAAKIKDNISLEVKEQRLQRLNELVNKYSLAKNQAYENKVVLLLAEGISSKDQTKLFGYTPTMKLVNFEADKSLIGKFVKVKITQAKSFSLDGEIVL